jgi:peroxiredoxin
VKLSAFRGRPVVLNLWATECGGCKIELPTFVDLRRRYDEKDLAVIGVSMDVMYEDLKTAAEGWARVRPFVQSHGLQYTILMDDGSVEKDYRVTAMPATFVIDKRGRVAATYVGVVDSTDLLQNVLAVVAERE